MKVEGNYEFFYFNYVVICLIGLLDKILNNRLGLVESFDKGINSMGSIAMSMIGFYCIAITLIQNNVDVITNTSKILYLILVLLLEVF
mgnify:CR=1 FL=1